MRRNETDRDEEIGRLGRKEIRRLGERETTRLGDLRTRTKRLRDWVIGKVSKIRSLEDLDVWQMGRNLTLNL